MLQHPQSLILNTDLTLIWQKLSGTSSGPAKPQTLYTCGFNLNLIPEEGLFFFWGTRAYITLPPGWMGCCSLAFLAPMADYAPGTSYMPHVLK